MKLTGDKCLCRACGEYFNSTKAFDMHRRGPMEDRVCLTPTRMSEKGMSKNAKGFWITEQYIDKSKSEAA